MMLLWPGFGRVWFGLGALWLEVVCVRIGFGLVWIGVGATLH